MRGEIIGRDAEMSVVQAFLDRPTDRPRALVLEGDAGIGKSTLWQAGVRAAASEQSFHVLTSRPAEAEGTLAHVVLGDLFADADPEVLAALPAPRRRAFESALLREEPSLPVDPRALGAAILTLMPALAGGRPLVLAIDDEQWVDPSSAAALGFALRRLPGLRVLLLLSRRLEGTLATGLEEAIDPPEIGRLRIGPLSMGAIQLVLRRRLGITFARPTMLRLHEVSGGNPFYALELARAESADSARDRTLPLLVPPSLERLVAARLGALDGPTRRALLFMAAHGRLPVGLLGALEIAPRALDVAFAASLIEESGEVLRFSHPLLASTLYQGVAGDERRNAHRRLATVLDDPLDRGRHLALGADTPDNDLADALESAVNAARDRGMPIAAAELAEHAVRLTPAGAADDWHRRAIAAARAHLEAGEATRAQAIADDVRARAPSGPRRAEALVLGAELLDPASAVAELLEALDEAEGVPALEALIHEALADQGRMTYGRTWADPHAVAALRLAEGLGDEARRTSAVTTLALLRFDAGDPGALELAKWAHQLAARLPDPRHVKTAGLVIGVMLMSSGSNEEARAWLEGQLDEWGERDERARSTLLWTLALVEVWSGRWSIASEYADQVREISVQYGEVPTDHLSPALIALHRGQYAVAKEHSQRALALANGHLLAQHVAVLGVCDLWSGNRTAGLEILAEAEHTADTRGWDDPNQRWWRAEYAEALLQLGRVNDASRMVAEWEAAAQRLGRRRVLALALRCRGLIAAAGGDLSTARSHLEEAVGRHEAAGDPFGRARTLLALGVVRRRARQKRTARAALEAAVAGFEALGAISWAATGRAELARIGGRKRVEGLSPSELPVANLVADGLANREIASALFLSEATVASHLTHIYAKLGVRSRTELARQMRTDAQLPSGEASKVHTS